MCRLFLCCHHTVELDIVDIMTVLGVRYVQMLCADAVTVSIIISVRCAECLNNARDVNKAAV